MSGRQVFSPTSVLVDFNPPEAFQSKNVSGGNVSGKLSSQNTGNKRARPLGTGEKFYRSRGDVTSGQMTNGIELIGYRMTNSQSLTTSEKIAVSQQASGWTPLSSELPPCRVCGEKASGLHYGVNTCEACKAFFRRTLKKPTVNFQCTCTPEEKLLGTDQPRKATCPKCRYERCIKTGMSKDAIKIGRYTISRKRQNDHEVKTMKQEDTVQGVGAVSSNSTSSDSPYDTSQSSPEELSSDITSLSLQEKKVPQKAKKRRHDDEDGLLYQSLTNSILMSLVENQQETLQLPAQSALPGGKVLTSDRQVVNKATPMEQLLISKDQDYAEVYKPYPEIDSSAVDSLTASYEQDFEDFSPLAHILSTYDQTVEETSPIEHLYIKPTIATNSSVTTNLATEVDGIKVLDFSSSLDQNLEMPISVLTGPDMITDNSASVAGLNTSLYGINDGTQISSRTQDQIVVTEKKESPIENLLTAPSETKKYSTILTVTYDNISNLTGNENMTHTNILTSQDRPSGDIYDNGLPKGQCYQGNSLHVVQTHEIPQTNQIEEHGKNVFSASELNENVQQKNDVCEFFNGEVEAKRFDEADLVETLENIEIQELQLYRFENPLIQVGQGISVEETINMILTLGKAAGALFDNTKKITCEEIKKRHAEYLEQYQLKMQLFGDMSNISKEEYLEFYKQTGIDIDNRQQILIEALKYMEESIAKLVMFAKAIPGFSDFDIDDQVSLVKASRFEHDMIQFGKIGKCVKSSLGVATLPWNKEYHFDEISKIFPRNFCTAKIENLQEIIQLGLSFEETVVLKALIITFPDGCALKERQKIEYLHNRLIACFLFLLGNRPPEKLVKVQAVLGALFKIRQLAAWDNQIFQKVFEVWPVTSNHQLVKEFIS